jgi:CubicO group peptidase (beta-lactamase class C family)
MGLFDLSAAAGRLNAAFSELIDETLPGKGGGAALALWRGNECLLSIFGGEASPGVPWNRETSCLIWSASKGVAAACTLHSLQEHRIAPTTPVADLWPEFAACGKGSITMAELLSHRAGLAAIDQQGLSITDHEAVVTAVAAQQPNWEIRNGNCEQHGYGARTFGFLVDEIVRRATGQTLSSYWNSLFREPLDLDLWFGIPSDKLAHVATSIAPRSTPPPSPFFRAFGDPTSLTRRALSEPNSGSGPLTPSVMNTPAMRMASIPSLGAIATADALARFYALLAVPDPFFTPSTRSLMQSTLSQGLDLTLLEQTSFSAGFMTNANGVYGPSPSAFGHPGAGGSLGFADPDLGIGFAFIPSAMHPGALPGPRTRKLVQALYGIAGRA